MPRASPHNRVQIKERRENILILLTKGMKGYANSKYLSNLEQFIRNVIHHHLLSRTPRKLIEILKLKGYFLRIRTFLRCNWRYG